MTIRPARESDLPELLAIYNYEVEHGVATLDLNPRTTDEWKEWFSAHQTDSHFILAGEETAPPSATLPSRNTARKRRTPPLRSFQCTSPRTSAGKAPAPR